MGHWPPLALHGEADRLWAVWQGENPGVTQPASQVNIEISPWNDAVMGITEDTRYFPCCSEYSSEWTFIDSHLFQFMSLTEIRPWRASSCEPLTKQPKSMILWYWRNRKQRDDLQSCLSERGDKKSQLKVCHDKPFTDGRTKATFTIPCGWWGCPILNIRSNLWNILPQEIWVSKKLLWCIPVHTLTS